MSVLMTFGTFFGMTAGALLFAPAMMQQATGNEWEMRHALCLRSRKWNRDNTTLCLHKTSSIDKLLKKNSN